MFHENDVVRLKHAIGPENAEAWPGMPTQFLAQGSRGTVVMVYQEAGAIAYEVEFVSTDGTTEALLTLTERDLESG